MSIQQPFYRGPFIPSATHNSGSMRYQQLKYLLHIFTDAYLPNQIMSISLRDKAKGLEALRPIAHSRVEAVMRIYWQDELVMQAMTPPRYL